MNAPQRPLLDLLTPAVRGWDRFWFTPMDPTTLACIRILGGLLTLYVHVCYCWDLLGYVGPKAWIDKDLALYVRNELPNYRFGLDWMEGPVQFGQGNYYWSPYFHVWDDWAVVAVHSGLLACMLLFTLGLWTPYTGLLTWVGAMAYVQRATSTVFGLDTMMLIVLLYVQFGPSGAVLSLDRWLIERDARRRGVPPSPVEPSVSANFAVKMIQFHFAFIYFASGTSKLLGSTWWSGSALNLVVLNPAFAPMDWPPYYSGLKWLAQSRWMWETVMSVSITATLLLEISFLFLVWDGRWRWLLVSAATMLHTGIGLIMGLSTFSLMMMVMLVSFYPPDVLKKVLAAAGAAVRRPAAKPA
ncbi:MAG: hypothetical protein ACRC33_15315 [Gemmataceae bacterium]